MKISILYFSQTGKTREMAEEIARGMRSREGVEVGVFDLEQADAAFVNDSKAVVLGSPVWVANMAWPVKKWLDEAGKQGFRLGGKIGAAFATANFIHGGTETTLQTILSHLMVHGALAYSGGASLGQPFIHFGPVAVKDHFEDAKPLFFTFGQRIADKTLELFRG